MSSTDAAPTPTNVPTTAPPTVPTQRTARPVELSTLGWRRSWVYGGVIWGVTHVLYLVVTIASRLYHGPTEPTIFEAWRQWDAWSYGTIAVLGYGVNPGDMAFFPLYPLLAHLLLPLLPAGWVTICLLLVSNAFGYLALVLLHRLLATEVGTAVADRTLVLFAAFPTAYFLAAPYNHSLFLALTLGFLYALRRRAWWLAAVLGGLASATRSAGVLLVLPFAFEYLRVRGFRLRSVRPDVAWLLVIPAGLVAFAVYGWVRFDDPLAFSHAQALAVWDRHLSWPGQTAWDTVVELTRRSLPANHALLADLAGTLLGLALLVGCVWGPWALRRDQWVIPLAAGLVLVLPLFVAPAQGNPLLSNARLLLDCAALFLVLGRALTRRVAVGLYLLVGLGLQVAFLVAFLRGAWTF